MVKGIPPAYANVSGNHTVYVLNQKCNRDFSISYAQARLHDLSKKKIPDKRFLRPGDVIINSTGTGTAGRIAQIWDIPSPTTIDGHMILMRPTDEIDPLYYGYALKAQQNRMQSFEEGSTGQTEINRKRFCDEVMIRYPSDVRKQKAIAAILFALDEKISLNMRINDNLAQQAQAIYEDMFITHANPEWGKGRLSDLVAVKYGKDHKKLADGEIPVYGSGGIMRYVERPIYTRESVLIPRKGTLNHVMYVSEPFWSVDTMFYTEMLRPDIAKFVYHFISGKNLASMNAGSAVPSMTTDILNAMELSIPDGDTLSAFEKVVSPMYQTMLANRKQSENLAKLRDALLPRLMSGELDVSEIEL